MCVTYDALVVSVRFESVGFELEVGYVVDEVSKWTILELLLCLFKM